GRRGRGRRGGRRRGADRLPGAAGRSVTEDARGAEGGAGEDQPPALVDEGRLERALVGEGQGGRFVRERDDPVRELVDVADLRLPELLGSALEILGPAPVDHGRLDGGPVLVRRA